MAETKTRRSPAVMLARTTAIIGVVNKYLSDYRSGKVTLRQMHYVLVEAAKTNTVLDYSNTENDYKKLSDMLADARREGKIDPERFEDRTRTHHVAREVCFSGNQAVSARNCAVSFDEESQVKALGQRIYWAGQPSFSDDLYQPFVPLIMLEKRALEGVFVDAISQDGYFVVCAGYNSYSQLYDLAKVLKKERRGIHVFMFSDFDPSGKDIARNFIKQLTDMGVKFAASTQVALTSEQVAAFNLPMAPVKAKDSRAANWDEGGVVELDALKPDVLNGMIRKCIDGLRDEAVAEAVRDMSRVMERIARRVANKRLAQLCANYPEYAVSIQRQYTLKTD